MNADIGPARLGARVRSERLARHVRLKYLAAAIGVAPSLLRRYEAGEEMLPMRHFLAIAEVLELSPLWLLTAPSLWILDR